MKNTSEQKSEETKIDNQQQAPEKEQQLQEKLEQEEVKKTESISQENEKNKQQQKPKAFKDLGVCDEICLACERLNYKEPTPIQRESLIYSLKNKDVIGLAETGSGKTLAFAIPIIQKLLDNPQPYFGLVLSPTRELCIQISEHFEAIGATIGLKCVVIVGGLDPMQQAIAIAKRPHVVIGTPGRILYHLQNTKGFQLDKLQFLVLDEADKLLNMDFEKEINQILEIVPKQRQTFLFSATMTNKVNKLQKASLHNPVKVEVSNKYQTVAGLTQNYLFIPHKYKDCYLVYLLNELNGLTTIIFASTCMQSIKLCLMIRNLGFSAVTIHGQMNQVKRLGALNKFKAKEKKILIATDVASRGLDIPSVDLVINYDIPQNPKDYIHRVGRTARAGKSGKAISICTQYDVESYQKIEFLLGVKLDNYKTEESQVLIFQERVAEASRIANQELKDLIDSKNNNNLEENEEETEKQMKVGTGSLKKKLSQNFKKNNKKDKKFQKNKKMKIDV